MNTGPVVLTYKDYEALPDDGRRYEIHEGELSVTPAPGTRHQRLLGDLYAALRAHVLGGRLGELFFAPVDVILSDTTIVQPDLVFVAPDRHHLISARGVEGPPTLVVEVLSPSTRQIDRHTKLQLYARHRIPFYWVVDPEARSLEAHALAGDAYALAARAEGDADLTPPPFPDFVLALGPLWA